MSGPETWMYDDITAQLAEQNRDEAQEYADARADYYAEPRFTRGEIAEMNAEAARENER